METNLILLIGCTFLKIIVLIFLATLLFKKWLNQNQKYYTDFPFLNSLGFILFGIGKLFDIFLYIKFNETPISGVINDPVALNLAKARFLVCPIIVLIPYVILMIVIWFEGKKKLQIGIGSGWFFISVIAVLLANSYPQLLIINVAIAFPPILISIITFGIINHQKRLPQINSLILTIGWSFYVLSQLIRSIWFRLGSGAWGLSWVGELVELSTLIIIGIGFMIPAFYCNQGEINKKDINEFIDLEDGIEYFNLIT